MFGVDRDEYSFAPCKESRCLVKGGEGRGTKITLEPPAERRRDIRIHSNQTTADLIAPAARWILVSRAVVRSTAAFMKEFHEECGSVGKDD